MDEMGVCLGVNTVGGIQVDNAGLRLVVRMDVRFWTLLFEEARKIFVRVNMSKIFSKGFRRCRARTGRVTAAIPEGIAVRR